MMIFQAERRKIYSVDTMCETQALFGSACVTARVQLGAMKMTRGVEIITLLDVHSIVITMRRVRPFPLKILL